MPKSCLKREQGLELLDDEKLPLLPSWNDDLKLPPSFEKYMDDKDLNVETPADSAAGEQEER